MAGRVLFRKQRDELTLSQSELQTWYRSELGEKLFALEKAIIEPWTQQCFGYHLLELSPCADRSLAEGFMVRSRYKAGLGCDTTEEIDITVEAERLPFPNDSLDVLIMHHCVEYAPNPHGLLREAARVLAPHGYLLIIGFNPWSLFGLSSYLQQLRRRSPWRKHYLSSKRIEDWLALLDFNLMAIEEGAYLPFRVSERYYPRLRRLEQLAKRFRFPGGSICVFVARKEIAAITPIRPKWQHAQVLPLKPLKPRLPTATGHRLRPQRKEV